MRCTLPAQDDNLDHNTSRYAKVVIDNILCQAEKDECRLAYSSDSGSELLRKQSGSYYTPVDVAKLFWNQFFDAYPPQNMISVANFASSHRFIEPACGSGVLVFALLDKLIDLGISPCRMQDIELHLVDSSSSVLDYTRRQFARINDMLGGQYLCPKYVHSDFLRYKGLNTTKPTIVFGNPPFVANPRGAEWKNLYADFLDYCLEWSASLTAMHFIVPLSLAFSRDFSALRQKLRLGGYAVHASHFDNVPDTLFKFGKPQSSNSNRANSQRCSIITALSASEHRLHSSKLHRWNAAGRSELLSQKLYYEDVTDYSFCDQFIRPSSREMACYLQYGDVSYALGDLTELGGRYCLHVGGVARNYVSIRPEKSNSTHTFYFSNQTDFYRFLGIIASDVFYDYWRSIGDGFHLTRSNILDFPVSQSLDCMLTASIPKIRNMWSRRKKYEKIKTNVGPVRSYDLSSIAPPFSSALLRTFRAGGNAEK